MKSVMIQQVIINVLLLFSFVLSESTFDIESQCPESYTDGIQSFVQCKINTATISSLNCVLSPDLMMLSFKDSRGLEITIAIGPYNPGSCWDAGQKCRCLDNSTSVYTYNCEFTPFKVVYDGGSITCGVNCWPKGMFTPTENHTSCEAVRYETTSVEIMSPSSSVESGQISTDTGVNTISPSSSEESGQISTDTTTVNTISPYSSVESDTTSVRTMSPSSSVESGQISKDTTTVRTITPSSSVESGQISKDTTIVRTITPSSSVESGQISMDTTTVRTIPPSSSVESAFDIESLCPESYTNGTQSYVQCKIRTMNLNSENCLQPPNLVIVIFLNRLGNPLIVCSGPYTPGSCLDTGQNCQCLDNSTKVYTYNFVFTPDMAIHDGGSFICSVNCSPQATFILKKNHTSCSAKQVVTTTTNTSESATFGTKQQTVAVVIFNLALLCQFLFLI